MLPPNFAAALTAITLPSTGNHGLADRDIPGPILNIPDSAPCKSYSAYNLTAFIPQANMSANPNTPMLGANAAAPRLQIMFGGLNSLVTMDTGGSGCMVSWNFIPGFDPDNAAEYQRGWNYYPSGRALFTGWWVPSNITFLKAKTQDKSGKWVTTPMVSTVDVLAIQSIVGCPGYDVTKDADSCPPAARESVYGLGAFGSDPESPNGWLNGTDSDPELEIVNDPVGMMLLGVGFGRTNDGFPTSFPERNAFLNIDTVGDTTVEYDTDIYGKPNDVSTTPASKRMRRGYALTDRGVWVGLTQNNAAKFTLQKLRPSTATDPMPMDWALPRACVSAGDSACADGYVIVDTGSRNGYIYTGQPVDTTPIEEPFPNAILIANTSALANGTQVGVDFYGIQKVSFTTGDEANAIVPEDVFVEDIHANGPNIKMGRQFYKVFDTLYDAQDGLWGLRYATECIEGGPSVMPSPVVFEEEEE